MSHTPMVRVLMKTLNGTTTIYCMRRRTAAVNRSESSIWFLHFFRLSRLLPVFFWMNRVASIPSEVERSESEPRSPPPAGVEANIAGERRCEYIGITSVSIFRVRCLLNRPRFTSLVICCTKYVWNMCITSYSNKRLYRKTENAIGVESMHILLYHTHIESRRPRWLGRLSSCLLKSISQVQFSPSAHTRRDFFLHKKNY